MTLSIGARLTAWYAGVVAIALAAGALAVAQIEARTSRLRLDQDLSRFRATVTAVLHDELGEGLNLYDAAQEASVEAIASQRTVIVTLADGTLVKTWGEPLPARWRAELADLSAGARTIELGKMPFRASSSVLADHGYDFGIVTLASLSDLQADQRDLIEALTIGVLVAFGVAIAGGRIFGRRVLRPLGAMARQAKTITEAEPSARLQTPNATDELGQLAAAFNALLDRLSTALLLQRQFMADASHQLRTPLSIVRATAQVILGRPERSNEDYRQSMTIVAEQSARLTRLVDAMFLLSRADAGGRPIHRDPVYIDEVVSECARGIAVLAATHNVSIVVEGMTDVAMLGDEELLRQVVVNLLDNAVRHTRAGGVVRTQVMLHRDCIAIDVVDQGPGISPEDRQRVFGRFVRLKQDGDGAGLGLAIASWVAEAHGGGVTLEESSEAGSRFRIRLSRGSPAA